VYKIQWVGMFNFHYYYWAVLRENLSYTQEVQAVGMKM